MYLEYDRTIPDSTSCWNIGSAIRLISATQVMDGEYRDVAYGAPAPFGGQLVLHVNTRPMDI